MICNSEVTESTSSMLLGMTINNDLKWKGHIYGKSGVLLSSNQRLFTIRRLSNHIHLNKLKAFRNDNRQWPKVERTHLWKMLSSFNQRIFTMRRLSNHIHQNKLKEIADSIWVSKLGYGLPLYSEGRTTNASQIMKELQK